MFWLPTLTSLGEGAFFADCAKARCSKEDGGHGETLVMSVFILPVLVMNSDCTSAEGPEERAGLCSKSEYGDDARLMLI